MNIIEMRQLIFLFICLFYHSNLVANSGNIQWKWYYSDTDDAFIDLANENSEGFLETTTPGFYAGNLVIELPEGVNFKKNYKSVFLFNDDEKDLFSIDIDDNKAMISLKNPFVGDNAQLPVLIKINPKAIKGKIVEKNTLSYSISFNKSNVQTVFTSPITNRVYHLVFNDEFNDCRIDSVKWDTRSNKSPFTRRGMFNGNPYYVLCHNDWTKELNGELRLEVSKYPTQESVVMTGGILTLDKFMPKYGYYETRVSFRDCIGEGYWPAFWLMFDANDKYRDGVEIDIFEYIPKKKQIFHTLHWYKKNNILNFDNEIQHAALNYDEDFRENEHLSSTKYFTLENADKGYHVFALEWTPDELIFYTNGKVTRRIKRSTHKEKIPQAYQMVYFSCSAGEWGGNVMNNSMPAYVYFDYCRCYQDANQDAIYDINGKKKIIIAKERKGKL